MRRLTDQDIANIIGSTIEGYHIEAARIKMGPFVDSDHYGIILGKNAKGYYVTWQFHLEDESVSAYFGHYFMDNRDAAIMDYNIRDRKDAPRKFRVTITETLKRTVEVEADDWQEAEQIVSDGWHSSEYILDADDFAGVEFKAVIVIDDTQ